MGEHSTNRHQILSLDGGGAKALFTAALLAELESVTDTDVAGRFDLVAGTSAGGLIALALGAGYRPAEIVAFFKESVPEIFPAQSSLSRASRFMRWLTRAKYDSKALQGCLRDYFGSRTLGESCVRLVIPACDSTRKGPHIFKTPHHRDLCTDYKVPMWQVAYATAAAPTYFPALVTDSHVHLVDGGVWANNPAMVALAEGLGYLGWSQESIALLSIAPPKGVESGSERTAAGGVLSWGIGLLKLVLQGQSFAASNECFHILGEQRFIRIEPEVAIRLAMDKHEPELERIGAEEARSQAVRIKEGFLRHIPIPYSPCYGVSAAPNTISREGGEYFERQSRLERTP